MLNLRCREPLVGFRRHPQAAMSPFHRLNEEALIGIPGDNRRSNSTPFEHQRPAVQPQLALGGVWTMAVDAFVDQEGADMEFEKLFGSGIPGGFRGAKGSVNAERQYQGGERFSQIQVS
jgi:hypothetical protein